MKSFKLAALLALSLFAGGQQARPKEPENPAPNSSDTDVIEVERKWPQTPRWTGPGPMPRHYMVTLWGVPAPYKGMTNPLRRRKAVLDRGKALYTQYCAVCHGDDGTGNGLAGRNLSPPPGNLVWLSDVPEKQWDEFMYWTIAEGGPALGTSMPPYRQLLTQDEIWAVTAYIQENIPFVSRMR
jgi:mono/diheme cytochrome c family protein